MEFTDEQKVQIKIALELADDILSELKSVLPSTISEMKDKQAAIKLSDLGILTTTILLLGYHLKEDIFDGVDLVEELAKLTQKARDKQASEFLHQFNPTKKDS